MSHLRSSIVVVLVALCLAMFAGCSSSGNNVTALPGPASGHSQASTTIPDYPPNSDAPETTVTVPDITAAPDETLPDLSTWNSDNEQAFLTGCSGKGGSTPAMCSCMLTGIEAAFTPSELLAAESDHSSAAWQQMTGIVQSCVGSGTS